jgi:hypothetical protein
VIREIGTINKQIAGRTKKNIVKKLLMRKRKSKIEKIS